MGTVPAAVVLNVPLQTLSKHEDGKKPSKDVPVVEFHCTGFGRFHNVTVNPTELLIRHLPQHLRQDPLPTSCVLSSATVLETAALACRATLQRMYDKIPVNSPSTEGTIEPSTSSHLLTLQNTACCPRVVFVHFGVNVAIKRFEIELQARNEATFSCPDEAGWSPIKYKIESEPSVPLDRIRRTSLPVHRLVDELRKHGFDVGISTDAGRYVCNWVYYNSLSLAESRGAQALFVHVPSHAAQPLETQLRFFSTLLGSISAVKL